MTKHENIQATTPTQDSTMPVETWQVRALLRIVGECRDPATREAAWFIDLADRAGLDLSRMETLNPKVAA